MNTSDSAVAMTYAQRFSLTPVVSVAPITDGSINQTFEVTCEDESRFILQRMAPLFAPSVMNNLAAVQTPLKMANVTVPEGLLSVEGAAYALNGDGAWYRALTYIPGVTIHKGITPVAAESAGRLIGRFHSALADLPEATLVQPIKHFHDTSHYIARMNRIAGEAAGEKREVLQPVVDEINERIASVVVDVSKLPQRIIHADLKVSNIRFSEDLTEALALIDMDTMMEGSVVVEMGDGLRSMCGIAGEDDTAQVFDEVIAKATLAGYLETAKNITDEEITAIPEGIKLLTLELAARFVTDAYEETYFAQSSHYASLYEQNKTKAHNQLRFLDAFEAKRHLL